MNTVIILVMAIAEPSVLLLGDSIRLGYQPYVANSLTGCTVYAPQQNCQSTEYSVEHIDAWLGGRQYAVIHCNWGLHDVWAFNCSQWNKVSIDDYRQNLRVLFTRLQRAARVVIFATTTPVPEDTPFRCNEDINRYNAVAREVCAEYGVQVNDLNEYMCIYGDLEMYPPFDCHPLPEGRELLGNRVAEVIAEQIEAHPVPLQWPLFFVAMLAAFAVVCRRRSH